MGLRSQNNPIASFRDVFSASGTDSSSAAPGINAPGEQGITATGGVVSEYLQGGKFYRAHVFTGTSTFDVTNIADSEFGSTVECLVVAGGGGGGVSLWWWRRSRRNASLCRKSNRRKDC